MPFSALTYSSDKGMVFLKSKTNLIKGDYSGVMKTKGRIISKIFSVLLSVTMFAGIAQFPTGDETFNTVSAANTDDPRITVDLNANDGRKASYARNAENWIVVGGSAPSTTIDGLTFTLSNGGSVGGDVRSVNCKILQKMSGIYPYMTMDGATIEDGNSGGVLKLTISGLSAGTHSLKTWHSCVDNATASSVSITINGTKTASGVKCPTRVTDEDDAGMSYSTFTVSSGQTVTVLISPEGNGTMNNAWLNAFEIDGADPFKGISRISPENMESHHLRENGLSWTAGSGAVSHNVYIGTDHNTVYNATTSSACFKGNQTGTTYALDETYQSVYTYYWRVDEVNSSGNVTKGAVNSFNVARLAFPTAEGYGRFARGGQGGVIVEVTNLNDSGEGSLRWALCDEKWQTEDWKGVPRIIVFKVGGVIALQSTLCIPNNAGSVYIAGQTAPGDGITLINYDFGAMGSTDVIVRDIRVRVGDVSGKSTGGMGLNSCNHTIIDHCSISWATDEGFSSRNAQNITFQWNIIGESLHDSVHYNGDDRTQTEPHSFAASISGDKGSFHHNLLIDCTGRNWSLAGGAEQDAKTYGGWVDIRNNVVYNWRDRTTDGGVRRLNFVNNYYKAGAVSNTNMHVVSIDGDELGQGDVQKMYVSGNMMVGTNGSTILAASQNAWDAGKAVSNLYNCTISDVRSDTPFFESYVNTETAQNAYYSVIAGAGAGGTSATGWDYIDSRYIKEVTNGTYTYTGSKQGLKGIIDSQNDAGGYPNTSNFEHSTACPADTDHDGMPDTWESEHGLNPNDASDGAKLTLSADGYTNVEMYLNELAGDPVEYNGTTTKQGTVIDTTHKYRIKNANSGLYLEVEGSVAANGTNVCQGNSGANGWTFEEADDGYYKLYSELGDGKTYLLDLDYGKVDNGTNIGIWGDTASDAQLFKFVDNGDGTYTITTKATEDASCLGIVAGSSEAGANVVQWACDGSANQSWILEIKIDALNGTLIQNFLVNDTNTYQYWSIDSSLSTGDLVFGDREGVTYTTVADELVGAEYVITSCDSKNFASNLATFTAGADIIVYVALDSRTAVPSWLSDWTATSLTCTNSKEVTFNLYSKEVASGEIVTLGSNGQTSGCVNYTVMAVEQSAEITGIWGDANGDGKSNAMDATLVARYAIGTYTLTDTAMYLCDVNGDGKVNAMDATLIARRAVGGIDKFPVES